MEEDFIVDDGLYSEPYYSDDFIFIDPYTKEEHNIRNPFQISLEFDIKELKSRVKNILSNDMGFKVIKGSNGKRNLRGYELYCYRLCVPDFIIFCLKFYKIKDTEKSIILYEFINGSKQYGIEAFYILKNNILYDEMVIPIETNYTNIRFNERTVLGFILSVFDDFKEKPKTTLLIIYYLERLKEQNIELFSNVCEDIVLKDYINDLIEKHDIQETTDKNILNAITHNMKRLVYDRLLALFDL